VIVTGNRADALTRLDVFVGEWVVEARFPGDQAATGESPRGRSRFEWDLRRQYLLQRTEAPGPGVPDSLAIVSADLETGAYTQHYYDSRGVTRLYAMSLDDGVWTLTRESPDFSRLDFAQRFIGTFSTDGSTISGAWARRFDGSPDWQHDFDLIYRRVG
jgi:hypothetical protein